MLTISTDADVKNVHLAEIYQSMELRLALLSRKGPEEFVRITPFVKCRDFLSDVYSSSVAKMDFGIYGMSFKGASKIPDWTGVYLLAQFPNDAAKKAFFDHMSLIREIEEKNGFKITGTVETPEGLLIEGDKKWLENCLTFSLYTFLLRCMCYPFKNVKTWIDEMPSLVDGKGQAISDGSYVGSVAKETWQKILADLSLLKIKGAPWCGLDMRHEGIGSVHHNSGFISVFGLHSEISNSVVRQNVHWQEMKKKGLKLRLAA